MCLHAPSSVLVKMKACSIGIKSIHYSIFRGLYIQQFRFPEEVSLKMKLITFSLFLGMKELNILDPSLSIFTFFEIVQYGQNTIPPA